MNAKSLTIGSLLVLLTLNTKIEVNVSAAELDYQMLGQQTAENIPEDIEMDSMARLPQVQRNNLNSVGQNAFDTYVSPGTGYDTGLRGPIGMLMHSPVLAEALFDVRQRVRYGTPKDQRLTELIIISTAREINNQYEYSAHEPLAIIAGLEQEIIDVVRYRKNLNNLGTIDGFGETERTIVSFTRELVSEEKVSAETFASAVNIFGYEGVVDITGLVGYYSFIAMTLKAFDVQQTVGSELLLPELSN
jgi:4-carboxymuconolactone decarboxylase